jgi:hypothetical protein
MHRKSILHFTIALLAATLCSSAAHGQGVSLQEQLNAQYKTVKMGSDSGGVSVVEPGTLLAIQKGGVLSVPWKAMAMCPSKFQDNSMHPSAGMCAAMVKSVSKYFQVNDKVYPVKIEVNFEKAKISFAVVACDSCNNVNPPTSMKGEVVFQFAKGYLEKAGAGEVEDTIGQVFSISNDDQQQSGGGGNQGGGNQAAGGQGGGQSNDQQDGGQDQQQPQNIQLGMTIDQVQQALGAPLKTVNLGAKQIYVYKDLKITFLNGKVSDVQ